MMRIAEAVASQFGNYPLYSVDASALMDFRVLYPPDVFPSMWDRARSLASERRLLICEQVDEEWLDAERQQLIGQNPDMVVPFGLTQDHFRQLILEFDANNVYLTDPSSTKDKADPYVVALGLMLDGRDPDDLQLRMIDDAEGVVVTHEKPNDAVNGKIKIPDACKMYRLGCVSWLDILRKEAYAG